MGFSDGDGETFEQTARVVTSNWDYPEEGVDLGYYQAIAQGSGVDYEEGADQTPQWSSSRPPQWNSREHWLAATQHCPPAAITSLGRAKGPSQLLRLQVCLPMGRAIPA